MNKRAGKTCSSGAMKRDAWPKGIPLFPSPGPFAMKALEKLPLALEKIWPLNAANRASLPADIADLSLLLTSERHRLRHSYWEKANYISAYLYYFLPWNIIRQYRLLQGINLPAPQGPSCIVDIGAGTMAFSMALWLARPYLHKAPLDILALDKYTRPMELGRDIFRSLGEIMGLPTWHVKLVKKAHGNMTKMDTFKDGKIWLISAANLLNEYLFAHAHRGGRRFSSFEKDGEIWDENGAMLDKYFSGVEQIMQNGTAFLAIEPGTRMGGESIMRLRELALEKGFYVHSPCTHQNACPLMKRNMANTAASRNGYGSAWCHFTFDTKGAPDWLNDISRMAGLAKKSLSLSPLLLSGTPPEKDGSVNCAQCRVLSRPFAVPGISEKCRYGCDKNGLVLLPGAQRTYEGSLLSVCSTNQGKKDKKSGAIIVEPPK